MTVSTARAEPVAADAGGAPPRVPGRAGLGVVSLGQGGDGIAYVARLLQRACGDLCGVPPRVLELAPASPGGVTVGERTRFLARLLSDAALERADWWIFNHVGIAQAQGWVPGILRRPYAVFLNGIEAWDPGLTPARRAVIRDATVRVAISRYTARRVAGLFPDVGPIVPCLLGLLPEAASAAGEPDADLLERVGPRSVAIVGRMSASERYKGHDQLIECWPAVLERVPDAQLVVAGRGDDLERLRRKAEDAGVGDRVLFAGFVSDATLHALLRRAGAFAMPSRGEGFGLVYLQAMQAGLPCVGSVADAAGDVIVDGETGFLVEPDDLAGLASSIARLLEDGELRGRFGEAGRRRFEQEFTYERYRDRLGRVLVDAFGTTGRRGR